MKKYILVVLFLTISFYSCHDEYQNETIEEVVQNDVHQVFGKFHASNEIRGVDLFLDQFDSFDQLIERTETIVCNDSLPKFTFKTDEGMKTVFFSNYCMEDFACVLIYRRNIIHILNDTILKYTGDPCVRNSLEFTLRNHLYNFGKNPGWCDHPSSLVIYISYDKNKSYENFPETLDLITSTYKEITSNSDLRIILYQLVKKKL